jgi:hypothetical protein
VAIITPVVNAVIAPNLLCRCMYKYWEYPNMAMYKHKKINKPGTPCSQAVNRK